MKAKWLVKMIEQEDYMSMDDPKSALEKDFKLDDNGVIRDPGKFEGEMYYVPYYYDLGMSGFSSESGGDVDTGGAWDFFELDAEDYKKFPELEGEKGLILWHDSQGFVSGSFASEPPEEEEYDDEYDDENGDEEEEPEESKKKSKSKKIANLAEKLIK